MTLRETLAELWLRHPDARPPGLELRRRRAGEMVHHHFSLWGIPVSCIGTIEELAAGSLAAYVLARRPQFPLAAKLGVDPLDPERQVISCCSGGPWHHGGTLLEALVELVRREISESPCPEP